MKWEHWRNFRPSQGLLAVLGIYSGQVLEPLDSVLFQDTYV